MFTDTDQRAKRRPLRSVLLAEAAALCMLSSTAMAALVDSGTVNIPIPDTIDGIYFNVVTGVASPTAGGAPGWDLNPYSAVAGQFNLWGATANTWFNPQGVIGGNYNLPIGTVVQGAAAVFFRPGGGTNVAPQFTLNSDQNFLGFRFANEANAGANHFGYMQVQFGATAATRTIVRYVYDNVADTPVTVGGGGGANTAPTLTYNPTTAAGVTFPSGPAGAVNATIGITSAGAAGTGQSAVTGCAISGPGAASFGAVTTTPANGIFNTGTTTGSINLSCTRGAAAATASLTCTETATPAVAGSPFTRIWALTCPAAVAGNVAPIASVAPTTLTGGTGSVTPTITTPAQGTGSTVFACTIPPTAPSNFAITSNASQTLTAAAPLPIGLSCVPQAAATTATLTCTQTATPGPNPPNATATITCPAAVVAPTITLTATVGTTPAVCAATDTLTVTAGTQVHYCYTVANTGSVALNFHDLTDTVSGSILNDFPFALAPGASAFIVVPSTPASTVTNTGTWTAVTALSSYTANDAIPFNFQDIAGTGTLFALTDDSVSAALPIGFSFDFFGQAKTNAFVSSNGFMTFAAGSPNGCCTGAVIPTAATPNDLIAAWWEDLNPSAGGTFHYQTLGAAPNRVFIVQMTNVPHFSSGNPVTLQYKLFEGSNNIEVHYQAAPSDGGTHSAGIENSDGSAGVQYFRGTTSLATPLAVRYSLGTVQSATATDSTTVTVQIPNIDVSPASLSANLPPNQSTSSTLTIANTGQGNLNWTIAEEPVAQPQGTPAGRGDASTGRETVSEADLKPSSPVRFALPANTWRRPEAVLFDNGPLVTHPGAGAAGANVSALQTALGLGTFGFGHQLTAGNRVADDFVVGGSGWLINTMTFFGYQTGSTTTSTFTAVNVRIWNGPPGAPGSAVVFGDTTTNRLVSSTYSGINRTLDTALTDATRPLMANVVAINTFLPAGTYWVDWQSDGSLASGPWVPAVSILGQTSKPGSNAQQFVTGAWAPLVDVVPQDLPFIVDGLADCANLADVPWLSVAPTNGTNVGGTSTATTVTFNSTGLAIGNYTARLCVASNDPNVGPGNGTGLVIVPVSLTVFEQADLVMTLTDTPDPVTAGTNLTYTATVNNAGPTAANNVSFSLPVPAGTTLVSATPSGSGTCTNVSPVTCTWAGSTAAGASNSAVIVVSVPANAAAGSTITATATATSPTPDPNLANNAATATTTVATSADLLVGLTASVTQTPINVPVTFTATSLNQGPSDAQDVSITVTLTPDFRYSSHSAPGATCTTPQVGSTGAIVCTWAGATAPGVTRTLTVVAFSNVEGSTVVNASTTSATPDPTPANNVTSVTVQVGYLVEEIPTLNSLGLLLMGLMIGLLGFVAVRRQA